MDLFDLSEPFTKQPIPNINTINTISISMSMSITRAYVL